MDEILAKLEKLEKLITFHGMLGFTGGRRFVYVQHNKNAVWTDIATDEPIHQKALIGYFVRMHRKDDDVPKLHVNFKTRDEEIVLCSGFDTHFSRDIMAGIAQLTPEQLNAPIKIVPQLVEKPKKGKPFIAGNVISVLDDRVVYTKHFKDQYSAMQLYQMVADKLHPPAPKSVASAPTTNAIDWKKLCSQYGILPNVLTAIAQELDLPMQKLNRQQEARLFHALQARKLIA